MSIKIINNFINNEFIESKSGQYLDVQTPKTGEIIARVALSNNEDVEFAVETAHNAYQNWSSQTVKTRVQLLFKIKHLIETHRMELAEIIMLEHGKNRTEALAEVDKANETVEYATSLPQLIQGKWLEVSRGVTCCDKRDPLGVVVSIVPFNFPMMVPFWTLPIAIALGNCMIIKPSEKVPLTLVRVMELFKQAGLPAGVIQLVNGTANVVEALCDHPNVKAVSFVGTTRVADLIARRCRNLNKRCLALGGAKNHLIAVPDCDVEMTSSDIVASYTGCAGQRCMAASVLLLIGEQQNLINKIIEKSNLIVPGQENAQVGPVIDEPSKNKIIGYIEAAEKLGAQILLNGTKWSNGSQNENTLLQKGFWVGPTVILHSNKSDPAMVDEIFGPVLSIYKCASKEEAIEIENSCAYGNAAAIYTSSGAVAEWFTKRFTAAMMGVNIGIPVPREPFSFGGMGTSKFGDFDITGDGAIEFFTLRKKITTKWTLPTEKNWMN
eukprot:TRINITY_DN8452_c0_g1_i1.p1 TRINITY_DN8452_c0_g1~~TRINITY_DN8452_c0_g1_i1.p1  ORF type:complete len:495 (-),score=279.80 TRINITY_DN8452_c0_g1_i1:73-1557(-)